MPANTTDQQITYPVGTDPADNPTAFIDMLADVESRLVLRYISNADRTARNPAPVTGQLSMVAGNTWYDRWTGAKWMPTTMISAAKTSDQTVNNTTALVDLTGLVVPLPVANTIYAWDAFVQYTTSTVADIKFSFTFPAGGEVRMSGSGLATGAVGVSGDGNFQLVFAPAVIAFGGAGANTVVNLQGTAATVGATGNLQMQFAQNALEISNTTVFTRSWLRATAIV